jgi:Abnormal spindle-like microcephaly-assoc'd, ASPM-SPD-2-Hydin/Beta-propeller repeat
MKTRLHVLIAAYFAAALASSVFGSPTPESHAHVRPATSASAESRPQLPLSFEENVGQTDPGVKFIARAGAYTAYFSRTDVVLTLSSEVVRIGLRGAALTASVEPAQPESGVSNYLIGNDPKRWYRNIRHFGEVRYAGVYRGVDLVYHGNQTQLEQDFVLAAGADAKQIQLRITGARNMSITPAGDLRIATRNGNLVLRRPIAYQELNGQRTLVAADFTLCSRNTVRVRVAGYDHTRPLIVDPVLDYSTFIATAQVFGARSIAADSAGNAYFVGATAPADNYPTTSGAYETAAPSGATMMAFVTKMNATGTALVYSTFIGGSGGTGAVAIALDAQGDAFVTGDTNATNFPVTANAFQNTAAKGGVFLAELDSTGANLLYSTYLAGSQGGENPVSLALDSNKNAYILGRTYDLDFPVTPTAFQASNPTNLSNPNKGTIFLTRLDPSKNGSAALIYSTFLGGTTVEFPESVAVDSAGNAYMTGNTASSDFPTTPSAYSSAPNNQYGDVFLTRIDTTKSGAASLSYSTYFGGAYNTYGTASDVGGAVLVQPNSVAAVVGYSYANTGGFPTTPNALDTTGNAPWSKTFLARFDTTKSGSASLLYSTLWGGTTSDLVFAGAIDAAGNLYMTGTTSSSDFPTSAGAPMALYPGKQCTFVTEFDPTGATVLFSTYWGGDQLPGSAAYGMAVDTASPANVYISGETAPTFPVTPGAYQTKFQGGSDSFVVKMSPGLAQSVSASPAVVPFGVQTLGKSSPAQTVTLINGSSSAVSNISISFTGANGADFSQTNTCGASLAANARCSISVTFTPSVAQQESATLNVADNATGSPQTVSLSGTGSAVSLSQSALSFGTQSVNFTSASQTVTLTNNAATLLSITSITLTGAGASFYAQTNSCGSSVAAGGNCTISVTFTPTTQNYETASVQIIDADPSSPQLISLSGTGGPDTPEVSTSPTTVNFGSEPQHSTTAGRAVQLSNNGTTTVTIQKIAISGTNASDFAETDNCGTALAATSSCSINVTFTPSTQSAESALLQITDSDPGSPQSVTLSGAGVSAVLVSSTTLNFNRQTIGVTSSPRSFALSNIGNVALPVTGVSITGTNAGDFAQTNNCGTSLAASSSCSVIVTFTPSLLGGEIAALQIADADLTSPQKISLSGTGASPVSASPSSLKFSAVPKNSTSSAQTVTLANAGASAANITGITITGANAGDFAQTNTCGSSLAGGKNCSISVTFTPSTEAAETATLQIADSDPSSPQAVALTGTGASPVSVSPTSLSFVSQTQNTTSSAQTVTLTNAGSSALAITGIAFGGANASDFAQTNTCGSSLAGGKNCTISVTFTPATTSSESATLQVNDSDATSPQSITLSGTGQAPPPPDFSVASSPASATVTAGNSTKFSISVSSANGFTSAVSFSCSGLPIGAACAFSPTTIAPSANGVATETVTINTAKRSIIPTGPRPPGPYPLPWVFAFATLAALLVVARNSTRRQGRKLAWAFAAILLLAVAGCSGLSDAHHNSGSGSSGTPAGNYTITITATSGTLTHSSSFALNVN